MKKSTKTLLIAAFCCVLVGLSFCIASFFFGISERGMTDVIQQGRVARRPDIVLLGMAVIGLVGALLTALLSLLEEKAIPWRKVK